jgi:EAL domain-containing protein (putative c-di-GMP-specific phosphodiesterase class I)
MATPSLLDAAIERGGLHPFFQAQVAMDGAIVGAEALARVTTPDLPYASPGPWVALAERLNRIDALTYVMARSVAVRARAFLDAGAALPFSINISPTSLARTDFADQIAAAVNDAGASCAMFTLEITDRIATLPSARTITTMKALRDFGFGVTADDFGAGHAGIDRLSELPFSEVKIDAAFTGLAMEEAFARKALDACLSVARKRGMKVVCKGVETEAMWAFVQSLAPDAAQGFLLHRPMQADALQALVTKAA